MKDWTKFEAYERGAAWRAMRHRLHFRPVEPPSSAELARELFLYTQRELRDSASHPKAENGEA